jgi:hypothetical protein
VVRAVSRGWGSDRELTKGQASTALLRLAVSGDSVADDDPGKLLKVTARR